ncbi:hypothetical protein PoB_005770800 [Plakobranchus ocellatus]|uniref:Uncharacterized protein n=1 Tax=Plakobranchus ocellatus TaxID=259542 RepID=A0AAV4CI05_9GAST|nr:hypothetical protein PoB_005770800 [Plakobranchus ocellatus]
MPIPSTEAVQICQLRPIKLSPSPKVASNEAITPSLCREKKSSEKKRQQSQCTCSRPQAIPNRSLKTAASSKHSGFTTVLAAF